MTRTARISVAVARVVTVSLSTRLNLSRLRPAA